MIPGKEPFKLEVRTYDVNEILPDVRHQQDDWYIICGVDFITHSGTHIEFPYHHYQNGMDAADYPIDRLIGEAIVLDFSRKADREAIILQEIQAYKDSIKEGDIIFIRTDKDKLYRTDRWNEQPYLTEEAMDWLVSRKPKIIGTDSAGFEVPGVDSQPNHLKMFQNNIAMVESATNLAAIGSERVKIHILPLRIVGIDACPVRIIAERIGE